MATAKNSVNLKLAKKTSGAVMFLNEDESYPISNIYFRKATLDKFGLDENTTEIKVTVEKVS